VECWDLALQSKDRPSLLALTRQTVPAVRVAGEENRSAHGAYVLAEAEGGRQITLLATGSEVGIALEDRAQLQKEGIGTAVVSVPCWRLFDEQDEKYRTQVLGTAPRVAVEAGIRQGWDSYIGDKGGFVGMSTFGASAPAEALFKHFGITTENVVKKAKEII